MNNFALICVDNTFIDIDFLFHYKIPNGLDLRIGERVRVPFGKGNALKIGYVLGFSDELPADINSEKIKDIHSTCDDFVILSADTITLAYWMREKYYCSLAACLRAILPSAKTDGKFPKARTKPANPAFDDLVESGQPLILTDEQIFAITQINEIIQGGGLPPILLHGVTGSGKTEVYLHVIADILAADRQAIVLVPEIALTPQMVGLFTARFGTLVAVTHSRLTTAERFSIWNAARNNEIQLVIGPRSAVFTPFSRLGLIVIDEEHEHTYHSETSPKYDAREVAIKRASLSGAGVILGSATPSLESYFKTQTEGALPLQPHSLFEKSEAKTLTLKPRNSAVSGEVLRSSGLGGTRPAEPVPRERQAARPVSEANERAFSKVPPEKGFELITLTERVNRTLPQIHVIDMRKEARRGNMTIFSRAFVEALGETIEKGQQAILFLNRRGYSSFVSCRWCGFVMGCDSCRVSFTYHADRKRLLCHYCGAGAALPKACPTCGSEHIKQCGTGTQRVEEEIKELFGGVKVLRMDMDTTRGKQGHAKILDEFRRGGAQVLIGTQMVAKGLDFPNVTMVGVVSADLSLHAGDFRSGEFTFQLLTQVAGRAGRSNYSGRVFIQTYNPEHYAIELAEKGDYLAFYEHEMPLRRANNYPPFSSVFCVMITGGKEREVIAALQKLAAIMEYVNAKDGKGRFEIIGFSPAFVSMIKKQFRWKLLAKSQDESQLVGFVIYCIKKLKENDPLKGLTINLTCNPITLE